MAVGLALKVIADNHGEVLAYDKATWEADAAAPGKYKAVTSSGPFLPTTHLRARRRVLWRPRARGGDGYRWWRDPDPVGECAHSRRLNS